MKKFKKKLLFTILSTIAMIISLSITCLAANEIEPNNGSNTASVIETDVSYAGTLSHAEDIDWYKFTNEKDYFKLEFDFNADYSEVQDGWTIEIYTSDGVNLIKKYTGVKEERITPNLPFEGDFLIKIEADYKYYKYAPVDCVYNLRVNTFEDEYWETEDNGTSATANDIEVGSTYKGSIYKAANSYCYDYGDVDYFAFTTTTGAFNVNIELDSTVSYDDVHNGWKVSIYPYGSSKEIVSYDEITSNRISFDIPYKGKFLVKIESDYDWESYAPIDCIYNLKITQHDISEMWEAEKNDTKTNATTLKLGQFYYANIDRNEDVDYFKYQVPACGYIGLIFNSDLSDEIEDGWKITVTNDKGETLFFKDEIKDISFEKNGINVKKGEFVYIKVESEYPYYSPLYVNYKLGVSFTAKTDNVSGVNVSQTTSSVKLSWNKIVGVKGYKIYTYNSTTKKYTLIDTTSKTTYTVKNLKSGTVYKYYVKAYQIYNNKEILSPKYTKIIAVTQPKAPTTVSATQSASVINLKWSASTGATGYRVYQYSPSKGKYVQVASVKTTSYKKTGLKAGTEYKFKIKPYVKLSDGTVIWGTASEAFTTATECKVPSIKSVTSPSKRKATVKWSNVDGETGYQLYYSTKKDSGFKKVDSYSANKLTGSKTFSSSASGKTIYFKVRAYKKVGGQTIYSDWSALKSVKLK